MMNFPPFSVLSVNPASPAAMHTDQFGHDQLESFDFLYSAPPLSGPDIAPMSPPHDRRENPALVSSSSSFSTCFSPPLSNDSSSPSSANGANLYKVRSCLPNTDQPLIKNNNPKVMLERQRGDMPCTLFALQIQNTGTGVFSGFWELKPNINLFTTPKSFEIHIALVKGTKEQPYSPVPTEEQKATTESLSGEERKATNEIVTKALVNRSVLFPTGARSAPQRGDHKGMSYRYHEMSFEVHIKVGKAVRIESYPFRYVTEMPVVEDTQSKPRKRKKGEVVSPSAPQLPAPPAPQAVYYFSDEDKKDLLNRFATTIRPNCATPIRAFFGVPFAPAFALPDRIALWVHHAISKGNPGQMELVHLWDAFYRDLRVKNFCDANPLKIANEGVHSKHVHAWLLCSYTLHVINQYVWMRATPVTGLVHPPGKARMVLYRYYLDRTRFRINSQGDVHGFQETEITEELLQQVAQEVQRRAEDLNKENADRLMQEHLTTLARIRSTGR